MSAGFHAILHVLTKYKRLLYVIVFYMQTMFDYFKTSYIICTFSAISIYNEYIRPFFIARYFYEFC